MPGWHLFFDRPARRGHHDNRADDGQNPHDVESHVEASGFLNDISGYDRRHKPENIAPDGDDRECFAGFIMYPQQVGQHRKIRRGGRGAEYQTNGDQRDDRP